MKIIRARPQLSPRQGGFGLIEVIITVAILGLLALATSSIVAYFAKNSAIVENSAAVGISVRDIELMLAQSGQCKANLQNTPVAVSVPLVEAPVTKLTQFNFSNASGNIPLATVGSEINGVIFDAIHIVPIAQISEGLISVELRMTLRKTTVKPTGALTRSLQLMAQVQGGKLQDCWTRQASGTLVYSQICYSATDGALDYYDQSTGRCTVLNGKWFYGTRSAATCPAGTYLPLVKDPEYDCTIKLPAGYPEMVSPVNMPMTDAIQHPLGRPGTIVGFQGNGCFCAYAVDIPAAESATAVCAVLCIVP